MITDMAVGSAPIPASQPEQVVELVIELSREMPRTDYDVDFLRSARVTDVKVVRKEKKRLIVSVMSPNGISGSPAASLHAICTQRTGQPTTTPPTKG